MTVQSLEHSFITGNLVGDHYREICALIALESTDRGYALLHGVDDGGGRLTLITEDSAYREFLVAANGMEV